MRSESDNCPGGDCLEGQRYDQRMHAKRGRQVSAQEVHHCPRQPAPRAREAGSQAKDADLRASTGANKEGESQRCNSPETRHPENVR